MKSLTKIAHNNHQVKLIRPWSQKLGVGARWYLWQSLHGFVLSLILAVSLHLGQITVSYPILRLIKTGLQITTATIQMHVLLKKAAEKRYQELQKEKSGWAPYVLYCFSLLYSVA